MLPLFGSRDRAMLRNVARLWGVVFVTNLVGAAVIAWVLGATGAFPPDVRQAFMDLGREAIAPGFGLILLRGVFAGWLIAMLVWMLPFAETARFFVVLGMTWLIGLGGFSHVVAGAIEVMPLAVGGGGSWEAALFGYVLPALIGNILGGVALVAVINHAQVVA